MKNKQTLNYHATKTGSKLNTIMPLNDAHLDQKELMQSTELDLLKCSDFEDNSWKNDECPCFHRDSKYNKDYFYEIYVCYKVYDLDGQESKDGYLTRPIITAMHNKEKTLGNVDGKSYFLDISEAIIACVRHDEEANGLALKKKKNLEQYHMFLADLGDGLEPDTLNTLQMIHNVWCDIHELEQMSADEMKGETEHQEKWLKAFVKAWEAAEEIGRFHHYAYENAGEEL